MSTPAYGCIASTTRHLLLLYVRGLCRKSDTGKITALLEFVMDSACSEDGETELPQDRVQKRGVEPSGSVTRQLQPRS